MHPVGLFGKAHDIHEAGSILRVKNFSGFRNNFVVIGLKSIVLHVRYISQLTFTVNNEDRAA